MTDPFSRVEQRRTSWTEFDAGRDPHRHIVRVIDLIDDTTYAPFLVMEGLDKGDLDDFMADWHKEHGKLPNEESVKGVLSGILNGLAHLHGKGIIHRDLKPSNILRKGVHEIPVIADLG